MLLREEVAGRWWQTCKMGVPALAFTVQGNLLFLALANLDAPTYQVLTLTLGPPASTRLQVLTQAKTMHLLLGTRAYSLHQVLAQAKTFFTALCSRLLIGRQLRPSQWLALLLLVLGASAAGLGGGGGQLRLEHS